MIDSILSGGWLVPFVIIALAITLMLTIKYIASRYKKIQPGRVGIFYGRKYKWPDGTTRGYLVVSGGGRVQMPLVENYVEIPTTAFQVLISEEDVPNKDTVKLTVRGVATCKISTEPKELNKAIDTLMDKLTLDRERSGKEPLEEFVLNILKGHLRSIIGKMNIDELLRKRDEFNKQVMSESAVELAEMGINLMNLVIQDIIDAEGYIDALGKQAVADAKSEAEIKVSNATSNAKKVAAQNEAAVALSEKERDVLKANYLKESSIAQADANLAGQIATTAQEQILKVAQAERDTAERTAQIEVQKQEQARRTAELEATTVADATASKKKAIIEAEAAKETRILAADAEAEYQKRTAQANRDAVTLRGEGEANAKKAFLVAEAEGNAAAKKEALLAEAEGTRQLADALAKMSTDARFIIILDKLPHLIDKGGDAGAKILQAIFGPAAAAIGQIDKISIVDVGGNGNGIGKVSGMVTNTVFDIFTQLKARGIDIESVLSKLGVKTEGLGQLLEGISPEITADRETS